MGEFETSRCQSRCSASAAREWLSASGRPQVAAGGRGAAGRGSERRRSASRLQRSAAYRIKQK